MKIKVITAAYIGNERDSVILSPQTVYDNVEYIAYTNDPTLNVYPWKIIVDTSIEGNRLSARHKKTQMVNLHADADYHMWIDSYCTINVDPNILVKKYLKTHDIITCPHPERNNIIEEALVLSQWKPDQTAGLQEAIDYYFSQQYAPTSLYETKIIIQRNTELIKRLQNEWWRHIQQYCIRDQISFPFICWKYAIAVNTFPGTHSLTQLRIQNKNWLPQWDEVTQ